MQSILAVTTQSEHFAVIRSCFNPDQVVFRSDTYAQALQALADHRCDLVFMDIDFISPAGDSGQIQPRMRQLGSLHPTIEIIVMAPPERIREVVSAVKAGASDYLTYPIAPEEIRLLTDGIRESIMLRSELDYLRDRFWKSDTLELVRTHSPTMRSVFEKIRSVAPTRSTVLLAGETGTGKNVLARLIHRHSNRGDAQFISVHCGAIPDTLIESELFGHEKGAFTGAVRRKLGKFETARGGTIFLDEIGTITPATQIKLLQVLQEGTFQRLGGDEEISANVRVISATNADLKAMTAAGEFRKDLYYRLNIFPIEIPCLRQRAEDIPVFVETFLKKLNRFNPKLIQSVHPRVMQAFRRYEWPGNIRELENLMERAHILVTSSILSPESFPQELFESDSAPAAVTLDTSLTLAAVRQLAVADIEKNYLKQVLACQRGRINASARAAGISTRQLSKLMHKHGLRKESFKDPS